MGRLRPRAQHSTPGPSSSLRVPRCRRLPARADIFRAPYRAQPIPSTRRLPCRSFLRQPALTPPRSQLRFPIPRPAQSSITRRTDRLPPLIRQNIRAPITVSAHTVINAIATYSGLTNSNVASATYTIQPNGTGINYGNGFAAVDRADVERERNQHRRHPPAVNHWVGPTRLEASSITLRPTSSLLPPTSHFNSRMRRPTGSPSPSRTLPLPQLAATGEAWDMDRTRTPEQPAASPRASPSSSTSTTMPAKALIPPESMSMALHPPFPPWT